MQRKNPFYNQHHAPFAAAFLAAVLFLGMAGCDFLGASSTGTLRLHLTDAPFPYDLATAANVTIDRVEIVPDTDGDDAEDEEGSPTVLSEEEQEFNLLELQDGVTALLAETELEAGSYTQLRLIVSEASVVFEDKIRFELKVPSGAQTGIKILLPDFEVEEDGVTELTLDFDVDESFVVQGNPSTETGIKGFLFKPVVKPVDL